MTKQEIRQKSLALRAAIFNRAEKDLKIQNAFLETESYQNAKTIMTYLSYKSEVDTITLLEKMLQDGKTVLSPVCKENGEMEAHLVSSKEDLAPGKFGILVPSGKAVISPEKIDLVICPGCAFTEKGFRLGYGGGYYDRFLPKTKAVTCGFFYEDLKTSFVPDETDIPLDMIVTEKTIYRFR